MKQEKSRMTLEKILYNLTTHSHTRVYIIFQHFFCDKRETGTGGNVSYSISWRIEREKEQKSSESGLYLDVLP